MKICKLNLISYQKDDSDSLITERSVIPTFVPRPNVKALDVTDMDPNDQAEMERLYSEYSEYKTQIEQTIFSFEDWLEHTQQSGPDVKWRTFKMDGIKSVKPL